jgi:autotransporter-associated beta strand protein
MGFANDKRARFALSAAVATATAAMTIGSGSIARADLYWDANDVTTGAGSATPTGTWGIDPFWSTDANGEVATAAWTPGETAVFSAGADATGAFAVTVDQTQTAAGIRFEEGDVTLTGGEIDLASPATVQVDAATARIDSILGGSAGLNKTGNGILTLGGVNTNSGLHTISAGTLRLGAAGVIADGAGVTVASGATFDLNNNNETIGALNGAGGIMLGSATLNVSGGGSFSGAIGGAGGFTKTGTANTLTLGGTNAYSGLTTISGGILSVSDTSNLGDGSGTNNIVFSGTAGTLKTTTGITTARNIALNVAGTINVDPSQTTTLNGVISGSSSLVKSGTGKLILTGTNTNTSSVQVTAGTLAITNASALGTTAGSTSVSNGATFELGEGLTVSEAFNTINGTGVGGVGAIRKTGNANSQISGTVTVASGANPSVISDGGTLTLAGTVFMGAAPGTSITYGGAGNITTTANAAAIGSGQGNKIFKTGSGTLNLNGNSSYDGGTVINGGTVVIDSDTTTVGNSARLGRYPAAFVANQVILDGGTLRQTIAGNAGNFVSPNRGIQIGGNGGTVDYASSGAGTVSIYSGIIGIVPGTVGDATLTKVGSLEFRYNGSATNDRSNTGYTKLVVQGGLFRLGDAIPFAGVNTELGFGAAPASPKADAIVLDGGAIGTSFGVTLNANRGVNVTNNGGILNLTAGSMTIPGVISGTGAIYVMGSGGATFGGANTYTGHTFIGSNNLTMVGSITPTTASSLSISSDANLGAVPASPDAGNVNIGTGTAAGTLIVTGDTTIDANRGLNLGAAGSTINVSSGKAAGYAGTLAGAGNLTKSGAGTLSLGGANTYAGNTTVSAGTLVLANADATHGGAIAVADGALAQAQAGLTKAVTVSTLNTNSSGKLDLTDNSMVIRGMTAPAVQALITSSYNGGHWDGPTGITSSTAAASTETSIGFASNGVLNLTSFKGVTGLTASDVLVKYTYAGDANLDGKVDIGDLGLLAGAWQQSGKVWVDGDFSYDGTVNIGDLGLLAGNWQKGVAPGQPLVALDVAMAQFAAFDGVAVPEPTGLALLGLAGAGLLGRRRRK